LRFLLAGVATLRGNDPRQRNAGAGGKGLENDSARGGSATSILIIVDKVAGGGG